MNWANARSRYALRTILTPEMVRRFVEKAMPMSVIGLPTTEDGVIYAFDPVACSLVGI